MWCSRVGDAVMGGLHKGWRGACQASASVTAADIMAHHARSARTVRWHRELLRTCGDSPTIALGALPRQHPTDVTARPNAASCRPCIGRSDHLSPGRRHQQRCRHNRRSSGLHAMKQTRCCASFRPRRPRGRRTVRPLPIGIMPVGPQRDLWNPTPKFYGNPSRRCSKHPSDLNKQQPAHTPLRVCERVGRARVSELC